MRNVRFGKKLKLPSTAAIKHQLLVMMLEDEIRSLQPGRSFVAEDSAAIAALRRLNGSSRPEAASGSSRLSTLQ